VSKENLKENKLSLKNNKELKAKCLRSKSSKKKGNKYKKLEKSKKMIIQNGHKKMKKKKEKRKMKKTMKLAKVQMRNNQLEESKQYSKSNNNSYKCSNSNCTKSNS
jgi:hypothetical protein